MDWLVRWFLRSYYVFMLLAALYYLYSMWFKSRLIFAGLVAIPLLILGAWLNSSQQRKKRGYYVDSSGGAEEGTVIYHEGEHTLDLYFQRYPNIIYVPTDAAWQEQMPDWAKDRKTEIMERIKSHYHIKQPYEETDKVFGAAQFK